MEKYTVIDDPHIPQYSREMLEKLLEMYPDGVGGYQGPYHEEPFEAYLHKCVEYNDKR